MNKPIWRSKTMWAVAWMIFAVARGWATGELTDYEAMRWIMAGAGAYGLRDAIGDGS